MVHNLAVTYRAQKLPFDTWANFEHWAIANSSNSTRSKHLENSIWSFKVTPGVSIVQTNAQWRALLEEWATTDTNISAQLADCHSWLTGKLRATYTKAFSNWPD